MRFLTCFVIVAALTTGCSEKPSAPAPQKPPDPPKILQFYASAAEVARGQAVTICYGVENAASVRIEPAIEQLSPSFNRCFQATPDKTTRYVLTAEGSGGQTVSESFTVTVKGRAAPVPDGKMILFFESSSAEITARQTATICYGVAGAASVRVTPHVQGLKVSDRSCFLVRPTTTTTYTLTATAADGRKEEAQVTVKVN